MEMYHVSMVVADLGQAMEDFGVDFGLSWRPIQGSPPSAGGPGARLGVTASVEARPALELLEVGEADWRASGAADTLHHLGYWVDDLRLETERLIQSGWTLTETRPASDGKPANVAYLRSPYGLVVELVDANLDRPWVNDLRPGRDDSPAN